MAEADERILKLPRSDRPALGTDLEDWYGDLIREMLVEGVLRREAEASGLAEEPAFERGRRVAERQIGLRLCLAALQPDIDQITASDLETAYTENAERFAVPERRFVHHLFVRRTADRSAEDVLSEAEALRDRVLRGENFARLAAERSDSEGRHKQGELGWMTPGVLPSGFDEVVFALEEGVPSEPVVTGDGAHLFYADQILSARTRDLAEVRSTLAEALVAQRRSAALEAADHEIETPDDALVLDREDFDAVLAAGDPEAVVLQIGDAVVRLQDVRRATSAAARGRSEGTGESAAWAAYRGLLRAERFAHHCRASGTISAEEVDERLTDWSEGALVDLQRRRRLEELAARDEDRLRLFYESNLGDFSSPPRWHIRRLTVPLGASPAPVVARLEAAVAADSADLDALAAREKGTVEDLGFVDLNTIRQISPKLPPLVTPLEDGGITPPYRMGDRLEMVEVVESQSAEPMAFEEVRERVAAAWVRQYTHEAYEALELDILGDGSNLVIDPDGLAALRAAGQPSRDVSVEQLEELFETL